MKNYSVFLPGIFAVLVITSGCQPKLAESPYGAREKQWEDVIKQNYPDWEPPQTVPPDRLAPAAGEPAEAPQIIADENDTVIVGLPEESASSSPALEEGSGEITASPAANTADEFQTYTVQKGDTLWSISRRFYASGKHWRRIFEANKGVIANPDRIRTGTELKIPAE